MSLFEEVADAYFNIKAKKYNLNYTAPECLPKINSDQVKALIEVLESKLEEQRLTNITMSKAIIDLQSRCLHHNLTVEG